MSSAAARSRAGRGPPTGPRSRGRRRRAWLPALLAIVALLAGQLLLSAYACPLLAAPDEPPPCHQVDPDAPALCKAFMQSDDEALDAPRIAADVGQPAAAPPPFTVAARAHPARGAPPDRDRAGVAAPPLILLLGRRRD